MPHQIDILGMLASIDPEARYQRGKALQYGKRTIHTYKLAHHHAQKRRCNPSGVPIHQQANKAQVRDEALANEVYVNLVMALIDSPAFRAHFRREFDKLADFARLAERIARAQGQLPRPPLGFQELTSGPDKGKLGFPDGHPLHPDNQVSPPPSVDNDVLRSPTQEQAQAEGYAAYAQGIPKTANPYPRNSAGAAAWLEGWNELDAKVAEDNKAASDDLDDPATRKSYGFFKKLKASQQKALLKHVGGAKDADRRNSSTRAKFLSQHITPEDAQAVLEASA